MLTLKQKRLFSSREFTLLDNDLFIKTKSLSERKEFSVKLESLGQQIFYESNPPTIRYIIGSIIALGLLFMTIAYVLGEETLNDRAFIANFLIWAPISLFIFLYKDKQDVHITGGQNIVTLYQNHPDKLTVDNFIQTVIKKSKNNIYKKYAKVDPDLPESQQMQTFHWLLTQDIIDEKEYNRLKQEYKTKKLI